MSAKFLFVVSLLLGVFHSINPIPIEINEMQSPSQIKGERGIWDVVGNWIQGSDWFPIQINIPQTIGSIGNGIMTFTNGIIQRIPFLNNRPDTVRPRPHYFLVPAAVPVQKVTNYVNEELLTYP